MTSPSFYTDPPLVVASWWKRMAAGLIDWAIFSFLWIIFEHVFIFILRHIFFVQISLSGILIYALTTVLVSIGCYLLCFVIPESSEKQATLGKRLFNLEVVDTNGKRLSSSYFTSRLIWGLGLGLLPRWLFYLPFLFLDSFSTGISHGQRFEHKERMLPWDNCTDYIVIDTKPEEKDTRAILVTVVLVILFVAAAIWGPALYDTLFGATSLLSQNG